MANFCTVYIWVRDKNGNPLKGVQVNYRSKSVSGFTPDTTYLDGCAKTKWREKYHGHLIECLVGGRKVGEFTVAQEVTCNCVCD